MSDQVEQTTEKKVINIMPLKKGRRILVFLADFFLNFIIAFLLFFAACFPLGKAMTGYKAKNNQYVKNLDDRATVLLSNKILFTNAEADLSDISYHVDFTSDCFLSYYALDIESPENVKYSQFGHKEENQVFHTYFISIMDDSDRFITLFDTYNAKHEYFVRDGIEITLKEEIKSEISTHFYKKEAVTSLGKKYLKALKNEVYFPMYSEIMDSIAKNDLTYNDLSYNKIQSQIKGFEKYIYTLVEFTSIIAAVISTTVFYLIIPLTNRSRKTIGMLILKTERVNIRSLGYLKKREVVLNLVYQLFMIFIITFFIPMTTLSFTEMFKIQLLFILAIFSILILLLNFVFLLFDKFNRSLFDRLLNVVNLTNADLDEVYRAKGYYL